MKRTMAWWLQAKKAMEKIESDACADLKSENEESRRDAISTLVSVSKEPLAGADFSRRVLENGVVDGIISFLNVEKSIPHVTDALHIASRLVADDASVTQLFIDGGIIPALDNQLNRLVPTDLTFGNLPQTVGAGKIGSEPTDSSPRLIANELCSTILKLLQPMLELYPARMSALKCGLTKRITHAACGPSDVIRRIAIHAILPLAEDTIAKVFCRDEVRRILTTELGLGGFEMLKLSVFRGQSVNDEESRFLFEIARHLELLPNLKVPGVAWYQPEEFPFTQALKEAYPVILEEFKRLEAEQLVAWPEKYLCKKGWDVFPFYAFRNKMEKNCAMCPKTVELIESIPNVTTAMFSCLQPRTHIKPHVGYQQYSEKILRCHLGIIVPEGCALKVNWEDRPWGEGEVMVFDDTFRHEAWNAHPDRARVVLMIDFEWGGKTAADGRNPDFVKQMEEEGNGDKDDAIISGDLLEAIKQFGAAQNITKGRDDRFK